MPYFITQSEPTCPGWAMVKGDGSVMGCHENKEDAIAHMVAASLAEFIRPGGERALPDNYRPALDESVPAGRACGNCFFYDETNVRGDKAWCEKWDDYVSGAYYCNAWQPDDNNDDNNDDVRAIIETRATPPNYMQTAAARGLELRREGFAGDGVTEQTVREAREMADGKISDDKIIRAYAWSQRHAVDLRAPKNNDPQHPDWPGAGAVAHYLWGINPLDPEPAIRFLENESNRLQGRTKMEHLEIRTMDAESFEIRATENGNGMSFGGYAAKYDSPSLPLPFIETIAPGAFDRTLRSKNDIRAYVNHDERLILGSTRAKTLRLDNRPDGLYAEIDLPETTYGRDLSVSIQRGDTRTMSFGFSTVRDSWEDANTRTLHEIRLHEVSAVTGVAAYPATSATVRNLSLIAKRTHTDVEALSDAIAALESGVMSADQADVLLSVVDRSRPIVDTVIDATPESTSTPLSILIKQLDLIAKNL